jgi:hypothetical protein
MAVVLQLIDDAFRAPESAFCLLSRDKSRVFLIIISGCDGYKLPMDDGGQKVNPHIS